ncbi:MAG: 2-dehydropantoate 2-reductase N-terminal domain-containing protein [Myxococcales bacterium]
MRFLVVGEGVIGSTYGWQLSLAGHEVTHWLRDEERAKRLQSQGMPLRFLDLRGGRTDSETVYRPGATSTPAADGWEVIVVSVRSQQLAALLPELGKRFTRGTFLFLQNLRMGGDELIGRALDPERVVVGYPFKAGGGRDQRGIQTVLFGNALTHTMLGRLDGRITPEVRAVARALRRARMSPKLTRRIVPYVRTHYVWAAASVAALRKAGSYDRFLAPEAQREAYVAMREGWEICRSQGIDPRSVSPTRYFYLPLWLLVPFTRWLYADEGMRRMFEGHVRHAADEMQVMIDDMVRLGDQYGLALPTLRALCAAKGEP